VILLSRSASEEKGVARGLSIYLPLDGTVDPIARLPSGRALRGFDEGDDGHLERPWTGDPVVNDSSRFLVTVVR